MGATPEWQSMQGIGYSEFMEVLQFKTIDELTEEDLEAIREKIVSDSVHYAKRQMTFFRSFADVNWIDAEDTQALKEFLEPFIR